MNDCRDSAIPFQRLRRMGLRVIDAGNHGCVANAVDALDTQLQIQTAAGDILYLSDDATYDFDRFAALLRGVRTMTIRVLQGAALLALHAGRKRPPGHEP